MNKQVPLELAKFVLPFNWDVKSLWALKCVVQERRREEFDYLLELPLWSSQPNAGMRFDVSPITVIHEPTLAPHQMERITNTDVSYPLEFLDYRNRCWILDGVHRLAKLYISGSSKVNVRIHDESVIPHIRVA